MSKLLFLFCCFSFLVTPLGRRSPPPWLTALVRAAGRPAATTALPGPRPDTKTRSKMWSSNIISSNRSFRIYLVLSKYFKIAIWKESILFHLQVWYQYPAATVESKQIINVPAFTVLAERCMNMNNLLTYFKIDKDETGDDWRLKATTSPVPLHSSGRLPSGTLWSTPPGRKMSAFKRWKYSHLSCLQSSALFLDE